MLQRQDLSVTQYSADNLVETLSFDMEKGNQTESRGNYNRISSWLFPPFKSLQKYWSPLKTEAKNICGYEASFKRGYPLSASLAFCWPFDDFIQSLQTAEMQMTHTHTSFLNQRRMCPVNIHFVKHWRHFLTLYLAGRNFSTEHTHVEHVRQDWCRHTFSIFMLKLIWSGGQWLQNLHTQRNTT